MLPSWPEVREVSFNGDKTSLQKSPVRKGGGLMPSDVGGKLIFFKTVLPPSFKSNVSQLL